MDDVRVGLFGLGHRGTGWLRLIQTIPGFRITAIGDLIPALHERGRAQLKDDTGVPAYTEYEDMLADPNVDAIALVVRAERQGAMAAQALEAGKLLWTSDAVSWSPEATAALTIFWISAALGPVSAGSSA